MLYGRAGQFQQTGGQHNSLKTCLRTACMYKKVVGLIELGKMQRMGGLLCAASKVMNYSL